MAIPVAVGDLIRIVLVGRTGTLQLTNNVFHYEVESLPAGVPDNSLYAIAEGFWNHITVPLRNVLAGSTFFTRVEAYTVDKNAFQVVNGEQFVVPGGADSGNVAGDEMPSFVTWTFKYVRPTLNFRHGWKRFAGVPEAAVSFDRNTAPYETPLNILAAALKADATFWDQTTHAATAGGAFHPVVIRRERGDQQVIPVEYAEPAAVIYNNVGTQLSRKLGTGA